MKSPILRKSHGEKLREKYFRALAGRRDVDRVGARASATRVNGKKVPIVFECNLTYPYRLITA